MAETDAAQLKTILQQAKVVAVVGLSAKPERDSHRVAKYLQEQGYRIVPVNPAEKEVLGEACYPELTAVPVAVDVVDVFRQSEHVPGIADQALLIGAKVLWLQKGVRHDQAAARAREAGLAVVQDQCMMQDHKLLMGA
jgi:hypothetical protein